MAAKCHFQPAAKRISFDCGNDRKRTGFNQVNDLAQSWLFWRLAKFFDVCTGNKCAALTGNYHGFCPGTSGKIQPQFQTHSHRMGKSVDGWIVDQKDRDITILF